MAFIYTVVLQSFVQTSVMLSVKQSISLGNLYHQHLAPYQLPNDCTLDLDQISWFPKSLKRSSSLEVFTQAFEDKDFLQMKLWGIKNPHPNQKYGAVRSNRQFWFKIFC